VLFLEDIIKHENGLDIGELKAGSPGIIAPPIGGLPRVSRVQYRVWKSTLYNACYAQPKSDTSPNQL